MASKEAYLATELDRARGCNLDDSSLAAVIADYFALDDSEASSDDGDAESDIDWEEPCSTVQTAIPVTEPVDAAADVDDSDSEHRDHEHLSGVTAALSKAQQVFDFVEVPQKRCHCHCKMGPADMPCIDGFSNQEQDSIRLNMQELTTGEKDLILLGMICCSINATQQTLNTKHSNADRKTSRIRCFYFEHRHICRDTFLYLTDISKEKLTNLKKHYLENGLVPRRKKSGGRTKTALTLEDVKHVTEFLLNFADQHGLVLPGRVPGFVRDNLRILPSHFTRKAIWQLYDAADSAAVIHKVRLRAFCQLWKQLLPFVVVAKPMSDLCWVCQQNNTMVVRSANTAEEQKSAVLLRQQEHLRLATFARAKYNSLAAAAKQTAITHNTLVNSADISFHYSFDFAQQMMYPDDPMQPGPIYFLVQRRCGLFGVHAEGISSQINYLIDEAASTGKGANSTISYLHHYLAHYGMGEKQMHLHADNCAGQNKNSFMMWYLAWRVLCGLHTTISIHFMLAGHTKFAPDWCFGLIKRKLRRTRVSCLTDIVDVVNTSSTANRAQLVGDETGNVLVPTFDWSTFPVSRLQKIKGIKRMQHFTFPADKPGVVLMRQQWDGPTTEMVLLQGQLPHGMPPTILPAGLTRDRQAYLFRHIRQFVDEDKRDIVCPRPAISRSPSPSSRSSSPSSDSDVPLSKRARDIGRGVLGRPGRARRGHNTRGRGCAT